MIRTKIKQDLKINIKEQNLYFSDGDIKDDQQIIQLL